MSTIKKENMKLNKLIQKINKENTPPEGWTPEAKEGAKIAGSIGLSLNDLNDSGDMAEELANIMNLDSDLYKNLK